MQQQRTLLNVEEVKASGTAACHHPEIAQRRSGPVVATRGSGHAQTEIDTAEQTPGDLSLLQHIETTNVAVQDHFYRRQSRRIMRIVAFERITIDPDRMGGVPCIRDLRVTVSMVLGQLAAGRTPGELLEDYPYLEPEDIRAALEYAAAVVNEREVTAARPA
jgi:uncharacterized protein (DUF433 family)